MTYAFWCLLIPYAQGVDLFEDLIQFKEDVINGIFGGINELGEGVFGKGKCGCPCRDYYLPKCEIEYQQQCYYEHYEQVCNSVAVPVVRQVKEIECQKCRKYKVAVPKTKWVKECNPVYDEKCKTEYHQHCKEETRCHIIYQTICDNSGYQQHCGSQPRQHCYPETKCHRTPDTQCVPVQKEKCEKVPVETTEFVEEKQCLPFQLDLSQLSNVQGDPCAGYHVPQNQQLQSTAGHHHHDDPHSGLGIASNTGFAYQQHPIANQYGIQDPILQDQPLLPAINQYEVKRENEGQLPSNPFLIDRRRQPKSIVVTMKRLDNNDYGRKGWVPIPYPLYK